jgi:hypothetical protein
VLRTRQRAARRQGECVLRIVDVEVHAGTVATMAVSQQHDYRSV